MALDDIARAGWWALKTAGKPLEIIVKILKP